MRTPSSMEWLWPDDASSRGSGSEFMKGLKRRPRALEAFLRAVARGVLRRRPAEVRALGYEQVLEGAVSTLWLVTVQSAFLEAVEGGLSVKQVSAYLARALEHDLAHATIRDRRSLPLDFEPACARTADNPVHLAGAADLAVLLRRRLPARGLTLLLARITGEPLDPPREASSGWSTVERALSLSPGSRKRLWTRVMEILDATLSERRTGRDECTMALRLLAEETRPDQTKPNQMKNGNFMSRRPHGGGSLPPARLPPDSPPHPPSPSTATRR